MSLPVGAIVVTEAGDDLGRGLCVELRGSRVAGLSRSMEALARTRRVAGPHFVGILCNVANPADVRHAFQDVRSRIGPVEVLVNNAATHPRRDLLDETAESLMSTLSTNLGGVMACTHEALSDMVERGAGRILNVVSFADLDPAPASSSCAVSAAAVRALTRALAADLADRFPRIVVSDWAPGTAASPNGVAPEVVARWGASLALRREVSLNGSVWQGDHEILPQASLGQRTATGPFGRTRGRRAQDQQAYPFKHIPAWVGAGGFGYHRGGALGCEALAFYFRSMEEAQSFLSAFPELELADETRAQAQSHPASRGAARGSSL